MELITGYQNKAHITSRQFRDMMAGLYNNKSVIMAVNDRFAISSKTNTAITIKSGLLLHHGAFFEIPYGTTETVTIENGTQGKYRNDLIVARYTKNESTGIENGTLVVIKGTATEDTPTDPAYNTGNMQEGALIDDIPIYRVTLYGTAIAGVTRILPNNLEVGLNINSLICERIMPNGDLEIDGDVDIIGKLTAAEEANAKKLTCEGVEVSAATPYVDFHYGSSTADYTNRIVAGANNTLQIGGGKYGFVNFDGAGGVIYPDIEGNYQLGKEGKRFYSLCVLHSVDTSSLAEMKTDIEPFDSALEEVEKTDVYHYQYKDIKARQGKDITRTGFIIGDDYNCSDLLISDSKEGIDLYSAVGVTFGAVKELYEIVKEQKETIEQLRSELDALKNKA